MKLDTLKRKFNIIIFKSDTPPGKAFDVILLILILVSVLSTMLETVESMEPYSRYLVIIEWVITVIFTIEYAIRIYVSRHPWQYIFSFYGIVDFLSILPFYLGLFLRGTQYLMTVRALRLLRVFRILKLSRFMFESSFLSSAMKRSLPKITVFLGAVVIVVVIVGSAMYVIESPVNKGFSSIPTAIYWAIVTLTTVGYGDIAPVTPLGKFISGALMILGYGIIAVPTGIVTVEMNRGRKSNQEGMTACPQCGNDVNPDQNFCDNCGTKLK